MKNARQQGGFLLIEGMIAILIFVLGILGLVAMGGTAMSSQSDARARTDAAALADSIANTIVLNVDRANVATSLNTFAHQPAGTDCGGFSGAASTQPDVVAWLARVTTTGTGLPGLPGATTANQQIAVDTSAGGFNRVTITVCWQAPTDTAMRKHTLVTYVNVN